MTRVVKVSLTSCGGCGSGSWKEGGGGGGASIAFFSSSNLYVDLAATMNEHPSY